MRFTQEQYVAVAAFFLANPTLGIPVPPSQGGAGYQQGDFDAHDLDARNFWSDLGHGVEHGISNVAKVAEKALPIAGKVASKALPIAGKVLPIAAALLKREEELAELVARYPESDLAELAARDPSWGSFMKGIKKGAKGAFKVGKKIAPIVGPMLLAAREVDDVSELSARDVNDLAELAARDFSELSARNLNDLTELAAREVDDVSELSARDLNDLAELAARDPSWGSFLKKAGKKAVHMGQKAAPVVGPILSALVARDFNDVEQLSTRDLNDLAELAARDPSWGSFLKKAGKKAVHMGQKAAPVVGPILSALVARDVNDMSELSARELDDLHELAARDPSFGSFLKKAGKKAIHMGQKAAPVVGPILSALVARDVNDVSELTTRELDDMAELAARDPSWGGFWDGVKNVGKEAIHVGQELAPVAKEAIKVGKKVAPVVGPMLKSMAARDLNDLSELSARDLDALNDLSARDLNELAELAARDPSWGGFWKGVKNVGKEAIHVGHELAPVAKGAIKTGKKIAPVVGPMLKSWAASRDLHDADSYAHLESN